MFKFVIFILSLFTIVLCGCNNNKELEKFIQSADKIIITKGENNETIEFAKVNKNTVFHVINGIFTDFDNGGKIIAQIPFVFGFKSKNGGSVSVKALSAEDAIAQMHRQIADVCLHCKSKAK